MEHFYAGIGGAVMVLLGYELSRRIKPYSRKMIIAHSLLGFGSLTILGTSIMVIRELT